MLAAKCHLGNKNCTAGMEDYVWKRNVEGFHILNLQKTYEKLMVAAKIIVAIENPEDVVAISSRMYGQRAVLKFGQYTGARYIAGRWVPGQLTNYRTKQFVEPRLIIVTDPRLDS